MKFEEKTYCDKCESVIEINPNPDRALCLTLTGGYGMFIDSDLVSLIFCHNCSVEFFRMIPQLSQDKFNGQHSVAYDDKDYPLCCEYSWMFDDKKIIFGSKENFKGR